MARLNAARNTQKARLTKTSNLPRDVMAMISGRSLRLPVRVLLELRFLRADRLFLLLKARRGIAGNDALGEQLLRHLAELVDPGGGLGSPVGHELLVLLDARLLCLGQLLRLF